MIKQRIILYHGDTSQLGIRVYDHQQDGVYRYFPEPEDKIKLELMDTENNLVAEFEADVSDPEYVYIDIDTSNLATGKYYYRVIIDTHNGKHHIIENKELYIRGDA